MLEVVGWALRVPGAKNKKEFWSLLKGERCSVSEIPEDRWHHFRYLHPRLKEAGKTYSFAAGVLEDPWGFDPSVFGVSPREAEQMDPQQRLLLQLVWEAVEDSGVSPSHISGENIGVYVGASALDYGSESLLDPSIATGHFMTGNTLSIISNRLSYIFDLKGPSFTVDTACSSSLVALHEAYRALSEGRIDTAVVAGVNILASPFPFVGFAQATMLSPEGLCRAFDAAGNGYVRAEGGVALVLRRKDAKRWKGQRSCADIVAVDVNSDGRTVGMSLPSEEYQASLLSRVYQQNSIDLDQLAFVEAHGTGTRVGDPSEAGSIGSVLAKARKTPLPIGSVKTNVGHLEPASGLVGLAKAMLALEKNYLPASLHFETPNPDIDFKGLNLEVAKNGVKLERGEKRRYAGVNSFGFGGTNAHVILSDPDQPKADSGPSGADDSLLMLSAQSKPALQDMAAAYKDYILASSDELSKIKAASFHRKARFGETLVLQGRSKEVLAHALDDFANDAPGAAGAYSSERAEAGKLAYAFSGNGAQWAGMGLDALDKNAGFRAAIEKIDYSFEKLAGWSLLEKMRSDTLQEEIEKTSIAQPLLFAVQVALCRALEGYGIKPDMVFGHSIGEVAAAHICGALDLENALKLVFHRSLQQEAVANSGTMAALVLPELDALKAVEESGLETVELAAINSPKSVSLSGSYEDIKAFQRFARSKHYPCKAIKLNYPFHSKLIDSVGPRFKQVLTDLVVCDAQIPMVSSVNAQEVRGTELTTDYWWRNLRDPVRFADAATVALEKGATTLIEIGPKAILRSYLRQTVDASSKSCQLVGSLENVSHEGVDPVLSVVARLVALGVEADTDAVFGPDPSGSISLPGYPWQNKPFRFESSPETAGGLFRGSNHRLLGWRPNSAYTVWHSHIDSAVVPFLADHVVNGQEIFPGTGFVEIALAAAREHFGHDHIELQTLDILQALMLSVDYLTEVQTTLSPETGSVEIRSRQRLSGDDWTLHATGRVFEAVKKDHSPLADNSRGEPVFASSDPIYARARRHGLQFGDAFQRAQTIEKIGERRLRVTLQELPEHLRDNSPYCVHPAELDGCFHGLLALFDIVVQHGGRSKAYVPIHFGKIMLTESAVRPAQVEISIRRSSSQSILADFLIFDAKGGLIVEIRGGRFKAAELGLRDRPEDLFFRIEPEYVANCREQAVSCAEWVQDAEQVLSLMDVTDEAEGEREGLLLLSAAAQRASLDMLQAKEQSVSGSEIISEFGAYFARLEDILVASELVIRNDNGTIAINDGAQLPEFDILLSTIVHEYPKESSAATLLANVRRSVLSALEGQSEIDLRAVNSSATLEHFWHASPDALARRNGLGLVLARLMEERGESTPVSLLLLGDDTVDLARDLMGARERGTLRVDLFSKDSKGAARASIALADSVGATVFDGSDGWPELEEKTAYDAIISCGSLHSFAMEGRFDFEALLQLLAPSGLFLALERQPDFYMDVVFGLYEKWFGEDAPTQFPVGALRTASQWADQFSVAGSVWASSTESVVSGASVSLFTAGALPESRRVQEDEELGYQQALLFVGAHSGEREIAQKLEEKLIAAGTEVRVIEAQSGLYNADDFTGWQEVLANVREEEGAGTLIVHLDGLFLREGEPAKQVLRRVSSCIGLAKAAQDGNYRLVLPAPSGSGLSAPSSEGGSVHSALWTFLRVLGNEVPILNPLAVDLDLTASPVRICEDLLESISSAQSEAEMNTQPDRLARSRAVKGLKKVGAKASDNLQLGFERSGSLDNLHWQQVERVAPKEGHVEIEVAATGLNFRDVMWSLGMLPEEALEDGYGGPNLGLEISGTVSRIGAGVEGLSVGDRVVAFTSGGFSSYAVVPGFAVAPIGEEQDLVAAATIPVAYITAYYALVHLGQIKKDHWVLLHGGAGGVGLAALQIAKWVGANVIATAGTPEKRELLSTLGTDVTLDSRSLRFADEVMDITEGAGVHAVLNSLAGEAMERSINVVRPFGRFLELGKRDFYANTKIGLRPFRRNVSYFGIDLDQILLHDKTFARELIEEVFEQVREGAFTALPHRVFQGASVQDAFRLMQRSGHIGKILVAPPKPQQVEVSPKVSSPSFDGNGYHLVVGGLGGFGSQIAVWLADNGARNIVLTSRSGKLSQEHSLVVRELEKRGVKVLARSCDVTNKADLESLLDKLRKRAPIKSVIHAAMVLDDGIIQQLTSERIEKVLAPKITGATLLDQLTENDDLDQFILFSSATTLIGNPGQASYVAANGYLEGLVRERRLAGKPGIAVGWGAISDVGFLARNLEVSDKISRHLGAAMITAREGLDALLLAMGQDDQQSTSGVLHIGRFDWAQAHQSLPLLSRPMFGRIISAQAQAGDAEQSVDIVQLVNGKTEEEATSIVAGLLAVEIAKILRLPLEDIGYTRPLAEFGMDSLMGLELRIAIQRRFAFEVPLVSLSGGTTLNDFASQILQKSIRSTAAAEDDNQTALDDLANRHVGVDMSDSDQAAVQKALSERQANVGSLVG
ncbi:SDR family NAD(P)-dependent oxidoreductase [Flexibacterium corallicola]|uniref:SDR family NAD(P)-dependent oxidoreductase n=1 Tax=Flexibacterium corallicola TaxID=3037259 RepID=UPI00286FACFD|nr:SDR family NAD(P)-dependent oxidoreductase [Pseudovibrio sp. M1P-2-3]